MKLKRSILILGNEVQSIANDALTDLDTANPNVVRLNYGRYPHGKLTQVFNKKAAESMAGIQSGGVIEWAKSLLSKGWHRLCGKELPCYVGHPYLPGAEKTADKSAKGWLNKIIANEDHAEFHFEWNEEGQKLIASKAFRYISPQWAVTVKGNEAFPFAMESCGLTNNPNTPCTPLANEDEGLSAETSGNEEPTAEQTEEPPNEETLANERAMGRTLREKLYLEPDATWDMVFTTIESRAADLAARMAEVKALRGQYDAELTARSAVAANEAVLMGRVTDLEGKLSAAETLANEFRRANAERAVSPLIASGHITIADQTATIERLATLSNEALGEEVTRLCAEKPKVKTTAVIDATQAAKDARTATLANEGTEAKARARARKLAEITARLAEEYPSRNAGWRHARAWQELRNSHPELL